MLKLGDYLRLRLHRPPREKKPNLAYYFAGLPAWLADSLRAYLALLSRAWLPERRFRAAVDLLSTLTSSLRWLASRHALATPTDLTAVVWYEYVDSRLGEAISPVSLNSQLAAVQSFLHFLQDEGLPICPRMLLLPKLPQPHRLPRDVPVHILRQIFQQIQDEVASPRADRRRTAILDRAWFLLMLHGGLRTCEVRFLRLADIDWEHRHIRIEQSKGLKDRVVFFGQAVSQALQDYLLVRGPIQALPDYFFVFRHQPLSGTYCYERLRHFCRNLGVRVSPHQLRHSCATLLLNAGAPILTVQAILGHKWIDTTLGYARLYDGTIAADYYAAMGVVEQRMALPEDRLAQPPSLAQLVTLLDTLQRGTLNDAQMEAVRSLRQGMFLLAEDSDSVVKVPAA